MWHWSAIILLVKTLVPVMVRTAAKRGVVLIARKVVESLEKEIRRKVESGEVRDWKEAVQKTVEEWKRWFDDRPGQDPAPVS